MGENNEQIRTATLILTEESNYTGRLCRGTGSTGTVPIEAWIGTIRDLVENRGIETIRFAGGEPLLYRGLPDLISYAKDLGADTVLCTNGTLADRDFMDRVRFCLDCVELTICSSEESTEISMGRHTQGTDHLKRTVKTSKRATERGMGVMLNIPVTRKCLGDDFTGITSRIGADRVRIVRMEDSIGLKDIRRYAVTDKEFEAFMERNSCIPGSFLYEGPEPMLTLTPDIRVAAEGKEGPITVSYKRYWNEGSDFEDLKTDIRETGFYRNTLRPFFDRFRSYMTEA